MGFRCPGMTYEGRVRTLPTNCLTAQGGGIAYDDNADWAEGEPEEMRVGHGYAGVHVPSRPRRSPDGGPRGLLQQPGSL